LLLDRSWLATVRDVSRGTHHVINPSRPSPAFRTASNKSWVWRPGNEAKFAPDGWLWLSGVIMLATDINGVVTAAEVPVVLGLPTVGHLS